MKKIQFYLKQEIDGEEITRDRLNISVLHPEEKESILDYYQKTSINVFNWNDVFGDNSLLGKRWNEINVGDKVAIDRWSLPYSTNPESAKVDDLFLGKVKRRITEIIEISENSFLVRDYQHPFDRSSKISSVRGKRTCQLTFLTQKEEKFLQQTQQKTNNGNDLPLFALLKE